MKTAERVKGQRTEQKGRSVTGIVVRKTIEVGFEAKSCIVYGVSSVSEIWKRAVSIPFSGILKASVC